MKKDLFKENFQVLKGYKHDKVEITYNKTARMKKTYK